MLFSVGENTETAWINVALDVQHPRLQTALVKVEEVLGFSQVLLD